MSKNTLEKTVRKEIEILNEQIDLKIIKGLSYAREARRHKFLVTQLSTLRPATRSGWFGRPLKLVSTFVL
ncbi:MAG: hypothetical protein V4473_01195 [Patescibacteria group bacterium]